MSTRECRRVGGARIWDMLYTAVWVWINAGAFPSQGATVCRRVLFGFSNFACNVTGVLLSALAVQAVGKNMKMCGFREAINWRATVVPTKQAA